jgi:hypothetical protein
MPKLLPEVFVSHAPLASWVSREVKGGRLRKLGTRVYTTNLKEPAEILVRRHAWFVVEEFFPAAIIADRTALEHRPSTDGSIFIISNKKRTLILPGLSIHPRKGHGPLEDDKPFMGNLYLSSPARAYLENMRKSRVRKGNVARTFSKRELEEKLEGLLQSAGAEALKQLRDNARGIAPLLGMEKEGKELDALIGTLLGTRTVPTLSPLTTARVQGNPYDPKRLDLFQKLYEALANTSLPTRTTQSSSSALAFFEAYFSNFIEGTEFEIDEAASIIFEGKIPKNRPADAHDIMSTYQIVSDETEMKQLPKDADAFLVLLKNRHALLMQGRPEMGPGEFKTVPNRAGSTLFVAPELVQGTLRKGFQWFQALNTPFQRAVFMAFLVAEVHPFADGNGRCGRIMMNAELVAANESRIIIPTIFRRNYLAALKALTHNSNPEPLIQALDFAQKYTSRIDWNDFKKAKKTLTETHAFVDSAQADLMGLRLAIP